MKTFKNEKGYALLMVLMLILLFTVLGMGLMATNMNSAKQFNMKEEQVQARHQAEMGLLHYQAEIKKKVQEYKFKVSSNEEKEAALTRSRKELCDQINLLDLPTVTGNTGNYAISDRVIEGCTTNQENKIIVTLRSTGISEHGLEKIVDGSIELLPPEIEITEEGVPKKPQKPDNDNPTEGEVAEYTEMTGPLTIDDESLEYDTLVINRSLTETDSDKKNNGQTLQFGPGSNKGEKKYLKVKEDLYVGGTIHSQNHACIYVRGNMIVKGDMHLGNKSIVIVYGNAYFERDVDLQNGNAHIFVAGNAYKGPDQLLTDEFKNFHGFNDKCGALTDWPDPEAYQPNKSQYSWGTNDELNPYYR